MHGLIHVVFSFATYGRLEDLVSQDDIVNSLTNLVDSGNLPHLLLYGPPGTGTWLKQFRINSLLGVGIHVYSLIPGLLYFCT